MPKPMTLVELHDAIAKAIADAVGNGMREKFERHADAVMSVVGPQLRAAAEHVLDAQPMADKNDGTRLWQIMESAGIPDSRAVIETALNGWARPPAQAAQVDAFRHGDGWKLLDASSRADPAAKVDGWKPSNDEEAEMTREFMRVALRAVWSAASVAAEPAAQGEVDGFDYGLRSRGTAWDAVCHALDLVSPGWIQQAGTGMECAVAAINALAAQPRAVPDGWVLVPIEPTDAMCDAGDLPDTATAYDIYKAMLAAAPTAETKA